jgi:hypothetical protein
VADRYPGYDVLAMRDSQSWNDASRAAVDRRLALTIPPGVLSGTRLATLRRLVARVCPDLPNRPPTTTVAMIVRRIADDAGDGYRHAALPTRSLDALDDEARLTASQGFAALTGSAADELLRAVGHGKVTAPAWSGLPPRIVWHWRLLPDLVSAHWAQPALWSAMGFGGPASPRGYVRLGINRRDPWEAVERDASLAGLPEHRE